MTQNDQSAKHLSLFIELIASFQLNALHCLGKLVNPTTGKAEVNLDGAAASINMLDMLAEKTKGNLNAEEANFLEQTLSHLKLNYVEEVNKPKKEEPPPPETAEPSNQNQAQETNPEDEKNQAES